MSIIDVLVQGIMY